MHDESREFLLVQSFPDAVGHRSLQLQRKDLISQALRTENVHSKFGKVIEISCQPLYTLLWTKTADDRGFALDNCLHFRVSVCVTSQTLLENLSVGGNKSDLVHRHLLPLI